MRHLFADWVCDECGEMAHTDSPDRPKGWQIFTYHVGSEGRDQYRHFCCQEHLDEWLKERGL